MVQEEETKPEVDAKKEAKKPDLKSVLQEKAASLSCCVHFGLSLVKAWDAGMKSVPQLLERFNMKDMQEEMVRSFKHLREASESESTEELEEATNHVKEMLSQLKELSEGIESSLSRSLLVRMVMGREDVGNDGEREAHGDAEEEEERRRGARLCCVEALKEAPGVQRC